MLALLYKILLGTLVLFLKIPICILSPWLMIILFLLITRSKMARLLTFHSLNYGDANSTSLILIGNQMAEKQVSSIVTTCFSAFLSTPLSAFPSLHQNTSIQAF